MRRTVILGAGVAEVLTAWLNSTTGLILGLVFFIGACVMFHKRVIKPCITVVRRVESRLDAMDEVIAAREFTGTPLADALRSLAVTLGNLLALGDRVAGLERREGLRDQRMQHVADGMDRLLIKVEAIDEKLDHAA